MTIKEMRRRNGVQKHTLLMNIKKHDRYNELKEIANKEKISVAVLVMKRINKKITDEAVKEALRDADFFLRLRALSALRDETLVEFIKREVDKILEEK